MASFTIVRQIAAPPQTVFDVITDHRGYAKITPMRKVVLEQEGDPAPNGVGAIRVLHSVGPPLREEVVAYQAPTRFSYKVMAGAPIRNHLGTVELHPEGDGTRMVYAVRMEPTLPLVGGAVVGAIKQGIKVLIRGVTKESERRVANAG
ncbi:MAG TPA: SRPBCC family protein [Solirubrobacterales bacterium]|nr:SRPBCC family protein [Solirubrobacterales bacterium]